MSNESGISAYLSSMRTIAEHRKICWELPILENGRVPKSDRWSLNDMLQKPPPPASWIDNFSVHQPTMKQMKAGNSLNQQPCLTNEWIELIKASAIEAAYIHKTSPSHIVNQIVLPLRAIATAVSKKNPAILSSEDVGQALEIIGRVQKSGKLRAICEGVISTILDAHEISSYSPLLLGRKSTRRTNKSTTQLRKELSDRKRGHELPSEKAFWELTRIVFSETPRSYYDCLRFEMIKLMIMLGLRGEEIASLPHDCLNYREYVDHKGIDAGERGGISKSLRLRHFAEKQRASNADGLVLFENFIDVPYRFEDEIVAIIHRIQNLTSPLRDRLRAQTIAGRVFPEFSLDDNLDLDECYPRLTGEPFMYRDPEEDELTALYKQTHSAEVLKEIEMRQIHREASWQLKNKVRQYSARHNPRLPIIDKRTGEPMKRLSYKHAVINVRDLEDWCATSLGTKARDGGEFQLSGKRKLAVYDLLFLGPKRALAEERNNGVCDITRYAFVGRLTLSDVDKSLSGTNPQTPSLFAKYSKDECAQKFSINSHDFRHLMNTELFRVGVADTVITKRFNRKSVAQSYEYDHRSLAEDLEAISIPKKHEALLMGNAGDVYKMIKAGRGSGPIADQFYEIQKVEGDEAAIVFLAAEADGFHLTPYGACLNSFVAEPCPKHLECFNGCLHLYRTGMDRETQALRKLEKRYHTLIDSLSSHPASDAAKDNARKHASIRLDAIQTALSTPIGSKVFPEGEDLATPLTKQFRGPFSDV